MTDSPAIRKVLGSRPQLKHSIERILGVPWRQKNKDVFPKKTCRLVPTNQGFSGARLSNIGRKPVGQFPAAPSLPIGILSPMGTVCEPYMLPQPWAAEDPQWVQLVPSLIGNPLGVTSLPAYCVPGYGEMPSNAGAGGRYRTGKAGEGCSPQTSLEGGKTLKPKPGFRSDGLHARTSRDRDENSRHKRDLIGGKLREVSMKTKRLEVGSLKLPTRIVSSQPLASASYVKKSTTSQPLASTSSVKKTIPSQHIDSTSSVKKTIPSQHIDSTSSVKKTIPSQHIDSTSSVKKTIPSQHIDSTLLPKPPTSSRLVDSAEEKRTENISPLKFLERMNPTNVVSPNEIADPKVMPVTFQAAMQRVIHN